MLPTIEVTINAGQISPMEPMPAFQGRGLLTLLTTQSTLPKAIEESLLSSKVLDQDRFNKMRGCATVKWRTDELMQLLRGDDQ